MGSSTLLTTDKRVISRKVGETLQNAAIRLNTLMNASKMWEDLLSEGERQRLGNDLDACFRQHGTFGIWRQLHDVSLEAAVIDIGEGIEFFTPKRADSLRTKVGLVRSGKDENVQLPEWDSKRGILWLEGKEVRRLRLTRPPTNIQIVLDAFKQQGWPARIDSPFNCGAEQLHQTLKSLNNTLTGMKFHATESAEAITWSLI